MDLQDKKKKKIKNMKMWGQKGSQANRHNIYGADVGNRDLYFT
jgi:hypothetical protein